MSVTSHFTKDSVQVIDSLSNKCGDFSVSDSIIVRYSVRNPETYNVKFKTWEIDCKCYYYFTRRNGDTYLIIVNDKARNLIVCDLTGEIIYMTMYHIKFPGDD